VDRIYRHGFFFLPGQSVSALIIDVLFALP